MWWRLVFVFVFLLLFVFAFVQLRRPLYEEATIPFLVLYLYSFLYLYFCTIENGDLCMRMSWVGGEAIVPFLYLCLVLYLFLYFVFVFLYYDDQCMGMRRWWWRMVRPSCRHRLRLWPVADVAATGRRTPGKATPPASAPATKLPETELEVRQENGRIAAEARKKQEKHRRATKQSHPGGVPSSLKISPHSSIHFYLKSINGCKCKTSKDNPNSIAKSIQILTRSILQPYCGIRSKAPARPGFTHLSMNCIF